MKSAILFILTALLIGGCSLTRDVPPEQSYQLVVEAARAGEPVCADRVIRVALLQAPQWLFGNAIYYAGEQNKFYRYTQARWEEPPVGQLQILTEKSLIEGGQFRAVIPYKSLAKNDWLLEIRIEQMLQHIDARGKSRTELMLYGVLVDQYSSTVVAEKTFQYERTDEQGNVQSAVNAWQEALGTYQRDLLTWLHSQCRAHPKEDRSDVDIR